MISVNHYECFKCDRRLFIWKEKVVRQKIITHAMEYLMYTDIPVIKIAMNNGFASVAAFNKVFKEKMELFDGSL